MHIALPTSLIATTNLHDTTYNSDLETTTDDTLSQTLTSSKEIGHLLPYFISTNKQTN